MRRNNRNNERQKTGLTVEVRNGDFNYALRKFKKMPLVDLFNLAVNNTLARTLMTSLTTLLALIALYAFGGEVIRGFVYALIFGILIGTYSSIFVASPVLLLFNIRRDALQVNEPFTEDDDDSAADAADGQKA